MNDLNFQKKFVLLQDKLLSYAMHLTANREDARDLLQDTAVQALTKQGSFREDINFNGWVYTLMRNIFVNNYRALVRNSTCKVDLPNLNRDIENIGGSVVNNGESCVTVNDIVNALDQIEDRDRKPLDMYIAGYSYVEISNELGIPLGTVKHRIYKTRQTLMVSLKDYV